MSIDHISVVIIARNAQETIEETLSSLVRFKTVILYLNDCDDRTGEIAASFDNVKVIEGDFIGFGPTKNKAVSYAETDWVLLLDSDEVLNDKLIDEILSLELNNIHQLFYLYRDNYFFGKKIRFSDWNNDRLARLYNVQSHRVNDKQVHEKVEPHKQSQKITLKNHFKHNAIYDLNQQLYKVINYSDLASKDMSTRFFILAIVKSNFAFFRSYIFHLGFLDGWRGYAIALSCKNGKFYRYAKRHVNYLKNEESL